MNPEWMAKIKAPNPETLVDRLNGIYPSAIGPYKASPLEKEAAGEIVRLRRGVKMKTDKEIVDSALELARMFYESHGYIVSKGHKFYDSRHPQEQGMWNLAAVAYEYFEGIDIEDALNNALDEEEIKNAPRGAN